MTALRGRGHHCVELDCDEELWEALRGDSYDVAFLALHGRYGEDGSVQGICELLGVPYTGSDVLASALCFNKAMAKKVLSGAGVATPSWRLVPRTTPADQVEDQRRRRGTMRCSASAS
jgi:D-alanine-D-alanine ligase